MLTLFITFGISFGIVSFIIGRRITQIREGKLILDEEGFHPEAFLADFDFHSIRSSISYYIKIYAHRVVLLILKQWIRFSFWIKEQKEKRIPKKEASGNETTPKNSLSQFISTLSEYKNHLKYIARKVKEREERKRE